MNIVYLIYNAIRIILICKLGSLFLKAERISKRQKTILILLFIVIHSAVYMYTSNRNVTLAMNFILYMIYTLAYDGSIFNRLFSFIVSYIMNIISEGAIYYFLLNFDITDNKTLILTFIGSDIILFTVEEIMNYAFKQTDYDEIVWKYKLFFLTIPFGSLYLCKILLDTYDISPKTISSIIVLFMINISFFFILKLVTMYYKEIHKQALINKEYKYYKSQIDIIKESDTKAAKARHDYKNHTLTVKGYVKSGELNKAEDYLNMMLDDLSSYSKIVDCGNSVIDNLFNYKLSNIDGINYKLNVSIPNDLFIPDYDLSIIIGNLLDNSINALMETEDKKLEVSIKYKFESLNIKFSNSYSGQLVKKGNKFLSTNKEPQNHGYGLSNIEEVVNRHNGKIEYITDNTTFTVKILLCNTSYNT